MCVIRFNPAKSWAESHVQLLVTGTFISFVAFQFNWSLINSVVLILFHICLYKQDQARPHFDPVCTRVLSDRHRNLWISIPLRRPMIRMVHNDPSTAVATAVAVDTMYISIQKYGTMMHPAPYVYTCVLCMCTFTWDLGSTFPHWCKLRWQCGVEWDLQHSEMLS